MQHGHRKDMIIKSNDTETFISVIIPAYNAEKYICSCLDSVLALSYQNKEIIAVDDGSTDNTGRIIDDYAEKNRNITVVHQTNKGVSAARNRGIDLARGTYLFFVDSDDEVLEDYIDQLIITGYEDLVQGGCNILENDYLHEYMSLEDIYMDYARYWIESQCSFTPRNCYRKELIDKYHLRFDELVRVGEDVRFNHQYLAKCKTIRRTTSWPYVYRQHADSTVHKLHLNRLTTEREECAMLETCSRNPVSMGRLKWIYWHRVLDHFESHLKQAVDNEERKMLKEKLRETYNDSYFRTSLPVIQKNGSKDEVIETHLMRASLHAAYKPLMKFIDRRRGRK